MTFIGIIQTISNLIVFGICSMGLVGLYYLIKDKCIKLDKTDKIIGAVLGLGAVCSLSNIII